MPRFDLQAHRGARGLRPENSLPGFEAAIDLGVSSIETDVHLTSDGVPVLFHDPILSERLCRATGGPSGPRPGESLLLSQLSLDELRQFRVDVNPDPARFPTQKAAVSPLAELYARREGLDPYAIPELRHLFGLAAAYLGNLGDKAGKTDRQRRQARVVHFDLELKRVPNRPEYIGDVFDGVNAAQLELRVLEQICAAGVLARTRIRSFDHRSVHAIRQLEPALTTVLLIAETVVQDPARLLNDAGASVYAPDYLFLDRPQIVQLHHAGFRVIPWTVNDVADWVRLLDWHVDGITTDYPDSLADLLQTRQMVW